MSLSNKKEVVLILKALQEGYLLTDDGPEVDYLICVSESRDRIEDFYPKKEVVKSMEENGLIEDEDKRPIEQRAESYEIKLGNGWRTNTELYPLVYLHKITDKGHKFLSGNVR